MNYESTPHALKSPEIWNAYQQTVEAIRGVLGNPVGEPVKDAVIGLNLFGIHTIFSGEGRMEDFKRVTAPFIDVASPKAKHLESMFEEQHKKDGYNDIEAENVRAQVLIENLKERSKLISILDEFYRERDVPYERRLTIESWKDNASHITNEGARLQELFDENVRRQKLLEYQEEMRAFGKFLKNKYLTE